MLTNKQLMALTPKDAIAAMLNDINQGNPSATPPIPALNISARDMIIADPVALNTLLTQVDITMRPKYAAIDYVPYTGSVTFTYNRLNISDFAKLAFINFNPVLPCTTQALLDQLALLFGSCFDPLDFVMEGISAPGTYRLKTQPNSLRWVGSYSLQIGRGNDILIIGTPSVAQAGVAYSYQYTAQGGDDPYTWTATGLPVGLTIDSMSGTIQGTTTTLGITNVTIVATDSLGNRRQIGVAFQVVASGSSSPSTTIQYIDGTFPAGTVGVAYQQDVPLQGSVSFSSPRLDQGTLPTGLSLSIVQVNHEPVLRLSGTPTTTFFGLLEFVVTDELGTFHHLLQQMVVLQPLAIVGTYMHGIVGLPYVDGLAITGGSGDYFLPAFGNEDGLPPGIDILAIDDGRLEIRGTPSTAGTFTFPVTILTGYGQSITHTLSLVVAT